MLMAMRQHSGRNAPIQRAPCLLQQLCLELIASYWRISLSVLWPYFNLGIPLPQVSGGASSRRIVGSVISRLLLVKIRSPWETR